MRTNIVLGVIWTVFIVKGCFYSALLPLWEDYDEFAHFGFVQRLALKEGLPHPDTRVSQQVEQSLALAPLPWALRDWPSPHVTHDSYWQLSLNERRDREYRLSSLSGNESREEGSTFLYEGKQPPLYYWLLSWCLRLMKSTSLIANVFTLRVLGLVIVSAIIPLSYILSKRVFGEEGVALQVAGLTAALPELYIDICRVTNDTLAIVLFTLFAYGCLRIVSSENSLLFAAFALGCGLLTKVYFATVVPFFLLVALWLLLRSARPRLTWIRIILSTLMIAAICGWWYGRNLLSPGAGVWIDIAPSQRTGVVSLARSALNLDWHATFWSVFLSHIWMGGWSFIQVRTWMYQVFEVIMFGAGLGVLMNLIKSLKKQASVDEGPAFMDVMVLAGIYISFLAGLAYDVLMSFVNYGTPASPGWYLYAVVVPEVLLIAIGLRSLPPKRASPFVVPGLTGCFALLELYTVHFQLIPYYTGFISHDPNAAHRSFHLSQLAGGGVDTILVRIAANKPAYLQGETTVVLWVLFVTATLVLPCLGFFNARSETPH